jgi:hypothetical protein
MSTFLHDPTQQETPGRPGHPRFDVDVVSPELPCGAAWLASALLELDVPLWKPWGLRDEALWEAVAPATWRHVCPGSPWSRVVPGLTHGREFRFRSTPVPRFTHSWPGQLAALPATVLFVRDPRDALYSAWRRARRMGQIGEVDFESFLASPYHHYPLSWARWLALFLAVWRDALTERRHLIVRFEDTKADPLATLRGALAFLGMDVSEADAQRACGAADHGTAAAIERRLVADGVVPSPILAGGVPYEYRNHFTPRMHAALGPDIALPCAWLGYEAPPREVGDARPFADLDREALLAAIFGGGAVARGDDAVVTFRRRLERVLDAAAGD